VSAAAVTRFNEFAVVFLSIILQSLPFVLVGVFASALVQQHLDERTLMRWLPRRPLLAVLAGSLFGLVAPVCDCGAIPLARRLAAKGVPGYVAVTFMLAAPVQGNWKVVMLRLAMTAGVAVAVGLAAHALLAERFRLVASYPAIRGGSDEAGEKGTARIASISGIGRLTAQANGELFEIALGALFTAAAQTFVPRGDLMALGKGPVNSVLVLMPIATLLSICSEADAFVARAFANSFTVGSVLAFMTIGQIVDLRNGFLLFRVVGSGLALLIVGLSYLLVFMAAVAVNVVMPTL
jgi:uncharacterized protein